MDHSYKSGGIAPYLVGGSMLFFGGLSTLTALMTNADSIINTGAGEGANAVVSIVTAGFGYAVLKSKSTLAAIGFGIAAIALIVGMKWAVGVRQAIDITSAVAGKTVEIVGDVSASTANSANGSYYQYAPQQGVPKDQYRHLTPAELSECNTGAKWTKSEAGMRNCSTKMCPVSSCGGG